MEVFLVRHGETDGNMARRHQVDNTPLTFKGEEQVRKVAAKIKNLKPTHIISSPLVRAIETARVIGNECDLIPDTNYYFKELKIPNHLNGNHHTSFRSFIYYFEWYFGRTKRADEMGESYKMFQVRINEAKKYLESFPSDARVVVVSHSVFINLFLAHVCRDTSLNLFGMANIFWSILKMPNTMISQISYNDSNHPGTCAWYKNTKLESSLNSGSIVQPEKLN